MSFLSKASLKVLLIGGFLSCALLTAISGGVGIVSLGQIKSVMAKTSRDVTQSVQFQNKRVQSLVQIRGIIRQVIDADAIDQLESAGGELSTLKNHLAKGSEQMELMLSNIDQLMAMKQQQLEAFKDLQGLMATIKQILNGITTLTIRSVEVSVDESIASIEQETLHIKTGVGELIRNEHQGVKSDGDLEMMLSESGISDGMDELMMVSEMSISAVRAAMSVQSKTNRQLVVVNDMFTASDPESLDKVYKEILLLKGHINSELVELPSDSTTTEMKSDLARLGQAFTKILEAKQRDLTASQSLAAQETEILSLMDQMDGRLIRESKTMADRLKHAMGNSHYRTKVWQRSQGIIVCIAIGLAVIIGFLLSGVITRPLNNIIGGISSGANEVQSASDQISGIGEILAKGASDQAASLEETSSSMEEMSSMAKKNTHNAGQADGLMKQASQSIEHANRSMEDLTRSMTDISNASKETSQIIRTIDEIAFQTNLLALNAAVEAARAGEAGAGFAVVADEVRNLAMRAAQAASDTEALIKGTVNQVSEGAKIVEQANDTFRKVDKSVSQVAGLVSEIVVASEEQTRGIVRINDALLEMDNVVQQNVSHAEESTQAVQKLDDQARDLDQYVSDLVRMVTGGKKSAAKASEPVLLLPEKK